MSCFYKNRQPKPIKHKTPKLFPFVKARERITYWKELNLKFLCS